MINQLLIIADNANDYAEALAAHQLPNLEVHTAHHPSEASATISSANIILGKPALTTPMLAQATRLEWLQSAFAGVELFCDPKLRQDYQLTGVKGIFGPLMSEYAIGQIIANERRFLATKQHQEQRNWQPLPYRSLSEITLGICGLGSIGQAIALSARQFGIRVLGLSRSGHAVDGVEKVYRTADIAILAAQVDYLVNVLPNTPDTLGLIDQTVLHALGPEGILINVGRGSTIDETALLNALENQQLGGAILDVFTSEPLPREHPLWGYDNVVITPHTAAVTFPKDIATIFAKNYQYFINNEPLDYLIDFERGY